jgi:hypothetical protein
VRPGASDAPAVALPGQAPLPDQDHRQQRQPGRVADTRVEDPDLWRFVHDSTIHIGVEPTIVADGRTPFEVFHDQRFLVLSPTDICRDQFQAPIREEEYGASQASALRRMSALLGSCVDRTSAAPGTLHSVPEQNDFESRHQVSSA